MYQTSYGMYDGKKWEKLCQICFKQQFAEDGYREVVASPGDFGIEGFTRSGKAFQCYCPDFQYNPDRLYDEQRDKITTDLGKLITYEDELFVRLGGVKIKEWIFYSPEYTRHEIIKHCANKTKEYRKLVKNSKILHPKFEVIHRDIDYLHPYLGNAVSAIDGKTLIMTSSANDAEIAAYNASNNALIERAIRKHKVRLSSSLDPDNNALISTRITVKQFIDGNKIISKWHRAFPGAYEKFLFIVNQLEDYVIEKCMVPTNDHVLVYKEIHTEVVIAIGQSFPTLDNAMVTSLANEVVADWVLRCPIEFV